MTVPNKGISFDNKEMCHILENISDADSLSDPNINPKEKTCQIYIFFWCADIRKGGFRCKFIGNTFLDGLFLYGHFGSLLTICGITIDNKILSLSHLLHDIGEIYRHMILFLKLISKYIPLDWNTMHIMCAQAKSFESAHTAVFSKLICTCSVHPLKNVMVHA